MSKFKIQHITRYSYEVPVRDSANQIMLYPLKDDFQEVLQQSISITGDPLIYMHTDYFGNEVGTFTHSQPHQELTINSRLIVVTKPRILPQDTVSAEDQIKELIRLRSKPEFIDFLKPEHFDAYDEMNKIIETVRSRNCTPLVSAKEFCSYVFTGFVYQKGITTVESTLDEVWKLKSGVCQDFAHILLVMLHSINIPARYVSGYICPNKTGMRGEGATHAWVEAYIPFYGWLGLDPTNNCVVNDAHVRLAVGKNFTDCSPVRGTYRGTSDHSLEVAVSVSYEDGHTSEGINEVVEPEPIVSFSRNSFHRNQEIQMQQ